MPTALVTGCSRETGFGQLTAKALAKTGFEVFATMRNATRGKTLETWADQEGVTIHSVEHDVTDPASNRQVVGQIIEAAGSLDVLVNNAGVGSFGALETLHDTHLRSVMETNFFAAVDLTRAALPEMRKQGGGRVIFVTSIAGVIGTPGESVYSASKFALEGLTEALAMEVMRFGIHVSTVRPGFFNTGMSAHNTDASGFYVHGTAYDAFNDRVIASTSTGELDGEDPQIVADTIVEAATTAEPKLRWSPGEAAPGIAAVRPTMSDEEWRDVIMAELELADWLAPAS